MPVCYTHRKNPPKKPKANYDMTPKEIIELSDSEDDDKNDHGLGEQTSDPNQSPNLSQVMGDVDGTQSNGGTRSSGCTYMARL